MSTQHTPGPWTLSTTEPDLIRADRYRVAKVEWNGWQTVERREGAVVRKRNKMCITATDIANARLIAAAPTMYEYIASSASAGCATAKQIMEQINGSR